MNRRSSRLGFVALAIAAVTALAGCSSSGSNSGGGSTGDPTGGSTSGSGASMAAKALQTAYTGVTGTPPSTPAKPKSGVKLWVVSCGQAIPSCATPVAGVEEAARAIGWSVKMCDGQLNPNGWGNCIRQASSAKADVVIPVGIDCVSVQAAVQAADAAGTKIIGGGGADCNAAGGKQLMATERLQLADTTIKQYWELNGKLQADWLIGRTNAAAKVVQLNFTDPIWGPWLSEGFKSELATCSGCSIVKSIDTSNADSTNGQLAQKFSTALAQATDANAVEVPIGGWLQAGLAQAVQASGRASKLFVASGFGDASTMDLIRRSNFTLGALGYASQWGGYGSVDEAIRILNGDKPVVEGDGFQMVDKDKNLPTSGDYQGGVDYKAAYRTLWGLS